MGPLPTLGTEDCPWGGPCNSEGPSLLALQSLFSESHLLQVQSPSFRGCPVAIIQASVCMFGSCLSHLLQSKPHESRISGCSCLPSAFQHRALNLAQIWIATNIHLIIHNLVNEYTLPSEFFWITFMINESPLFWWLLTTGLKGSQMVNCDRHFYQGYFGDCIFVTSNANLKGWGWTQGGNVYLLSTVFHGRNFKWLMVNNKKTVGI